MVERECRADSTFSPGNNFDTNKYYIDFAARNGLDAHGIYGYAETPWYYDDNFNFGWAGPNADVTKPIPCLNMPRIVEYARSKGLAYICGYTGDRCTTNSKKPLRSMRDGE